MTDGERIAAGRSELPRITGSRLRLRPIEDQDAQALFAVWGDPEVMRHMARPPLPSEAAVPAFIAEICAGAASGRLLQWAIAEREQDRLIGTVTLAEIERRHRRCEIGFALARDRWRQGLMQEALRLILHHAFETMGLQRIEADVDPDNAASLKLLTRLGFEREGYLRRRYFIDGCFRDGIILSLLATDYSMP